EGRGLPRAFPKRSAARRHRRIWSAAGGNGGASPFDRVSQELAPSRRAPRGREPKTTMAIIGAQSIKNADTAEGKGYGAGKKLRGWRGAPPLAPTARLMRFGRRRATGTERLKRRVRAPRT
ncbi:MAG: hypothetical protein LBK73_07090, partial [Treponema sp.]|nr:hypothetical protein [Treponema sp.]